MLVMKYLNLFIFVLLLAGCNRPVKHSDIIQADTMVSIIPQEDTITLSALFSRCEIVKLNDIVLASINKVFKYDSLWIVQGKSDQGGVHLFNNEGRYLKTVLKWGQGPEEAYDIWSIKLLDGSIYLLTLPPDTDPNQQGLCLYRRVAAVRDQHEEQDLFCVHRTGEGRHPAPHRRREIHDPALERSGRERPRDDVADDDEPRQPPPDQGAAHRRRAHLRRV